MTNDPPSDSRCTVTTIYRYDPPLSPEEVEEQLGPDARRFMEIAIINEALRHAVNHAKVGELLIESDPILARLLLAEHFGYDELATIIREEQTVSHDE